jgi:hypothetical protein
MFCRNAWNPAVIDSLPGFSKAFRMGELKQHRLTILLDRERSLLPLRQRVLEQKQVMSRANLAMRSYETQYKRISASHAFGNNVADSDFDQHVAELKLARKICSEAYQEMQQLNGATTNAKTQVEHKTVTRKCGVEHCRGFLNNVWRCGVCAVYSCKECFEPKGEDREALHTCKPEDLLTAKSIETTTKACPKCGMRIMRSEGCSQMFCTSCHTPFDWNTGRIIEGRVHNPHAFEYFQRLANENQTTGFDPALPCDGNIDQWDHWTGVHIVNGLKHRLGKQIHLAKRELDCIQRVGQLCRLCVEQSMYPPIAEYSPETYQDLGVRYLEGGLSEDSWRRSLSCAETKREKHRRLREITQLLLVVSADIMRFARDVQTKEQLDSLNLQIEHLRSYLNELFANASSDSKLVTKIDEYFVLRKTKKPKPLPKTAEQAQSQSPVRTSVRRARKAN